MTFSNRSKGQAIKRFAVLAGCSLTFFLSTAYARVIVPVITQSAGPTPFIENVTVDISEGGTLDVVYYTIDPKPGSKTRPVLGSYTGQYLAAQGFQSGKTVKIPVPFLYAGSSNHVTFVFFFTTDDSD